MEVPLLREKSLHLQRALTQVMPRTIFRDARTDGQGDSSIPPNFVCGDIKNNSLQRRCLYGQLVAPINKHKFNLTALFNGHDVKTRVQDGP